MLFTFWSNLECSQFVEGCGGRAKGQTFGQRVRGHWLLALDWACTCTLAQGSRLVGVQNAGPWLLRGGSKRMLRAGGHACPRAVVLGGLFDWGLGLAWGCVIDVEWM